MKVDTGKYNKNQKEYSSLINKIYQDFPHGVTLPPEYAHFVSHDLLRFLIRLSRYKFVSRVVKKSDTVLEVGCGSGLGSIFVSQHCKSVCGIDIKTTEIHEANSLKNSKNVQFLKKDLFEMNDSQKYDVVFALDVIEHMNEKKGKMLLEKMGRLTKKNGLTIIGTPSIYSYPYQSKLSQASHVKCYDQNELSALVESVFGRAVSFSMNDEVVHTGNPKMSWYYFVLAYNPKSTQRK